MIADYMRIILLYFEGGIYMDIKTRPKIPLDEFINTKSNKIILFEYIAPKWWEYINLFLISPQKHKIYKKIINRIHDNIKNYNPNTIKLHHAKKNVIHFTGPWMITDVINKLTPYEKKDIIIINNKQRSKFIQSSYLKNYHKIYKTTPYSKVREHLLNIK